jgi:hypothetical protein
MIHGQTSILICSKKFGKPTAADSIHMQNGYGAQFSFPKVTWTRPDYVVNAHEDMVVLTQTRFILVEMATASRMRRIESEKQTKKNSLD